MIEERRKYWRKRKEYRRRRWKKNVEKKESVDGRIIREKD